MTVERRRAQTLLTQCWGLLLGAVIALSPARCRRPSRSCRACPARVRRSTIESRSTSRAPPRLRPSATDEAYVRRLIRRGTSTRSGPRIQTASQSPGARSATSQLRDRLDLGRPRLPLPEPAPGHRRRHLDRGCLAARPVHPRAGHAQPRAARARDPPPRPLQPRHCCARSSSSSASATSTACATVSTRTGGGARRHPRRALSLVRHRCREGRPRGDHSSAPTPPSYFRARYGRADPRAGDRDGRSTRPRASRSGTPPPGRGRRAPTIGWEARRRREVRPRRSRRVRRPRRDRGRGADAERAPDRGLAARGRACCRSRAARRPQGGRCHHGQARGAARAFYSAATTASSSVTTSPESLTAARWS